MRYKSVQAPREALKARIREISAARVSLGYRQVRALLRREGWQVNHKSAPTRSWRREAIRVDQQSTGGLGVRPPAG